ncbi:hypothetical protein HanPSC8_Chr11g0492391 [Helianthus annuus]|nr:hypothetical protein HanPSC8_Chr11g0492391 [Helianthus annuus]
MEFVVYKVTSFDIQEVGNNAQWLRTWKGKDEYIADGTNDCRLATKILHLSIGTSYMLCF